jgi:hypothetical protein
MPTTFITAENMPAVLAQATERIARLETEPAARDEQIAEQAIQIEELHEQDMVQAAAFRAAQTQLRATIRAIAGTNGSPDRKNNDNGPNGKKQSAGDSNAKANGGRNPGNVVQLERQAGERQKKAGPPKEDEPPPRKKAHRWL